MPQPYKGGKRATDQRRHDLVLFRKAITELQKLIDSFKIPIIKIGSDEGCQELGKCLCQILAKQQVLFLRLCNLQVELPEMKQGQDKLVATLLETLPQSESSTEAQAVIRDFLNHIKPKTK